MDVTDELFDDASAFDQDRLRVDDTSGPERMENRHSRARRRRAASVQGTCAGMTPRPSTSRADDARADARTGRVTSRVTTTPAPTTLAPTPAPTGALGSDGAAALSVALCPSSRRRADAAPDARADDARADAPDSGALGSDGAATFRRPRRPRLVLSAA